MFVVAGVSGHVGSVVASELLSKGKPVKVIVRDAAKGKAWADKGAQLAVGSLEDQAFLTQALSGAQGLFVLLPPNMAFPTAEEVYAWQRKSAATIGAAVAAAKVPLTVMLSSIGADLPAGNGPIKGLHHLENELRASGTKLVAIRAGFFMENIGGSLAAAKHAGVFPNFMPSADLPMPMIATVDIGKLAAASLLDPPASAEVVDLSGPAYTAREQADKLGKALGKAVQVVDIPPAGWLDALLQAGLPKAMADIYVEMYQGFMSGAIRPKGDRMVQGTTPIDGIIASLTS